MTVNVRVTGTKLKGIFIIFTQTSKEPVKVIVKLCKEFTEEKAIFFEW